MYKPLPDNPLLVAHPAGDGSVATHQRFVAGVANMAKDGTIFLGVRHFCPLMRQNLDNWIAAKGIDGVPERGMAQGFVDQHGTFMDRKEAKLVAVAADQIKREIDYCGDELFSEHLH